MRHKGRLIKRIAFGALLMLITVNLIRDLRTYNLTFDDLTDDAARVIATMAGVDVTKLSTLDSVEADHAITTLYRAETARGETVTCAVLFRKCLLLPRYRQYDQREIIGPEGTTPIKSKGFPHDITYKISGGKLTKVEAEISESVSDYGLTLLQFVVYGLCFIEAIVRRKEEPGDTGGA